MSIPVHIVETASLLLAVYLIGCVAGFALRRLSRWRPKPAFNAAVATPVRYPVARPTVQPPAIQPAVVITVADLRRPSAVARLPMAVSTDVPEISAHANPLDGKPDGLASPRATGADNLRRIKGIGPRIEERLNSWGLYHFDQLAALTPENAAWIDRQLGFKGRVARENWIVQATALAAV